jgi:hypothetical protein
MVSQVTRLAVFGIYYLVLRDHVGLRRLFPRGDFASG